MPSPRVVCVAASLFLVALVALAASVQAQDAAVDADGGAPSSDGSAERVVPPVVVEHARPTYPADGDGRRVDVELLLTIDEQGTVSQVEVLGHIPSDAPESFDVAARQAARGIRFRPAQRGGQPVMVRARYHMAISPPLVALDGGVGGGDAGTEPPEIDEIGGGTEGIVHSHGGAAGAAGIPGARDGGVVPRSASVAGPAAGAADAAPTRATGSGERGVEEGALVRGGAGRGRAATQWEVPVGTLAQVPRQTGSDILTLAPGVLLSNEGGEGHAQHVFLRGFTGANGQDIAFTLDGVPLNEESNTHSQGYVDLYFVIPELVQRLDVTHGVADPRQGNFAVAGSVNYHLALRQRGVTVRGSYGVFNYARLTALYGPERTSENSFVGIDLVRSDGFGPARGYDRASALAQHEFDLGAGTTARVLAGMHASRWVSPGVIREDDYDAGRVGFFDVYPGAGRQGGYSTRALVAAALDWRRARERAELRAFAQLRDLQLTENFTGFLVRRDAGDLIEQRYGGATVGANGYYQRAVPLAGRWHEFELGWFLRHDRYSLGQRRLEALTDAPAAAPEPGDIDADVHATNVGTYVDATARVLDRLTLRAGVRLDAMAYDVDARAFRPVDQRVERAHRNAIGVHVGPKATAEVNLGRGFTVLASHGSGFRSPDALTLADGESAPFTSVMGQELGLRYALSPIARGAARLAATLAGYHTFVAQDLLFDPVAGRAVPIGATRRIGAVLYARAQPLPWIDVNASLTYTRAVVESDALGRTVPAGSLLPYVPPWVARLDAAADRQVALLRGVAVRVRGGLGVSYYGPRPLPLDDRSEPVGLVDASAGSRVGPVALDLSVRNLFDVRWRDAQLNSASIFVPGATPSLFPVRHFTAGAPFTLFATVTLYL